MAITTHSTIVAVYSDVSAARAAADELKKNGFREEDLYISAERSDSAAASGSPAKSSTRQSEGGITGWFKRIFGQEDHEDQPYYENATKRGNVVLSVDATSQNLDSATNILNRYSPIDVHREQASSADADLRKEADTRGGAASDATQAGPIPVINEELRVGKRSVLRGGVRIYTRTVEEPVEETLRLQEERIHVDRQPADRAVSDADMKAGAEQVIEMKEYAEEPVVSKQARVTEEIRAGKDTTQREQTIRDTVRHTEVDFEDLGTNRDSALNADFRRDFESRYGSSGGDYNDYGPAYNYGYAMAADPRYQGKRFNEVESDLRTDYGRRYPNSTWEKIKDSVRYGWDKVTGKASSATGAR
jgi:uncharacterized protein (TIGR02271 family)